MNPTSLSQLIASLNGSLVAVELHSAVESISGEDILAQRDLAALRLAFSGGSLWIHCLAESDEIALSDRRPSWASVAEMPLTTEEPWAHASALPLTSASILTNQQGYADAVQLHFGPAHGPLGARIQVEAVASAFWFWRLAGPFAGRVRP